MLGWGSEHYLLLTMITPFRIQTETKIYTTRLMFCSESCQDAWERFFLCFSKLFFKFAFAHELSKLWTDWFVHFFGTFWCDQKGEYEQIILIIWADNFDHFCDHFCDHAENTTSLTCVRNSTSYSKQVFCKVWRKTNWYFDIPPLPLAEGSKYKMRFGSLIW